MKALESFNERDLVRVLLKVMLPMRVLNRADKERCPWRKANIRALQPEAPDAT